VTGPVERVDRRLHRDAEPAGDLAAVTLLQEREVAVDVDDLLADGRVLPLPRSREIAVQLPRAQPPSKTVVSDAAGEVKISVPRDREGTFTPQIVKRQFAVRSFDQFDDPVVTSEAFAENALLNRLESIFEVPGNCV
jgi:hypothetical protein